MSSPILQVENLVTAFDTDAGRMTAVDGISFDVPRGKTLGIVGESGCGKSVTAFSITRLLPQPHGKILGGSIRFEGRDLAALPVEEMQKIRGNDISMIFQEPMTALNPVQTVGRQLAEAILLHTECSKADVLARSIDMMKKVRIPAPEQRLNEYPHQLSGGMRQRMMIAMALINKPKLLIADEPTTALDVTVQAQILQLIADLQKEMGMSVILITHDLGVIAEVCDEVAVMYAGRIVEQAGVFDLFSKPRHAYTQGLLESIPRLDSKPKTLLKAIPGNVPGIADFKPGCRFAERSRRPHTEEHLTHRPPVVEIATGHWVESCPVCVGLAVADFKFPVNLNPEFTHDHEDQSHRLAQASHATALSILGRDARSSSPPQSRASRDAERQLQLRQLADWARTAGKLIDRSVLGGLVDQGSEHSVFRHESTLRVWKMTYADYSGINFPDGCVTPALPHEYFERWILHNDLFDDDVCFEGVVDDASGIALIISQLWLEGDVPTRDQVDAFMAELGFKVIPGKEDYYRRSDEIAVLDCHLGNFILGEADMVFPIDIHPMRVTSSLKAALNL